MSDRETFRWLCTERSVVLGPYADDEIRAWLDGIATMRSRGIAEPVVIRAGLDAASAEAALARLNTSR